MLQVSRLMRSEKDENGEQLFDYSEFLTSRQISSFFSRLASKRSLDHQEVNQSDDDEQIRAGEPATSNEEKGGV